MTTCLRRHRIATAVAASLLLLGAAPAFAAGFQLNEVSGSGLGNAFAGAAASAEDASTLWSNVAGLSRLGSRQVVGVLHVVTPSINFRNNASVAAAQQTLGGDGGDAGGHNWVPNLYLAMPINNTWAVGLGVNAPWGLVTDYGDDWVGRFQGDKSSIQTMNINPGVSWKPASSLALGLGLNLQRMVAEFTNRVNYSGVLLSAAGCLAAPPVPANCPAIAAGTPGLQSAASIKGSDNAWGWNAGLLWDITPAHRLGLSYRSAVTYHLEGGVHFDNPAVPAPFAALGSAVNTGALYDSGVRADVKLPPIANLSYFGAVASQWDVMADLQWTGWSTVETLRFVRSNGAVLQNTPENFKDSWKLAVGANFRPGGAWTWRGGLAYDQAPVRDAYRTPRLPDADRTWLTAGAQWRPNPQWRLDLGAAYLWTKKATIDANGGASAGWLNGSYSNHTVIVSGQATWLF